jgi:hypothetical protein
MSLGVNCIVQKAMLARTQQHTLLLLLLLLLALARYYVKTLIHKYRLTSTFPLLDSGLVSPCCFTNRHDMRLARYTTLG